MFQINMQTCDEITRIYERQASECVRAVNIFYDEVMELARRTAFKPMVDFGNAIYRFYYGELRRHLMSEFRSWYDSGSSFHALMQKTNAGDAAIQTARNKMDQMEGHLESLFRMAGSEVVLDTSAPVIENKDFEDYRQALSVCLRIFSGAQQGAEASIRSMGSENDVTVLITDIVKTTGLSLEESFEKFIRQVTEGEEFTSSGRDFTLGEVSGKGKAVSDNHVRFVKGFSFK